MKNRLSEIEREFSDGDIWQDKEKSDRLIRDKKQVSEKIEKVNSIEEILSDVKTLIELYEEEHSEELLIEIEDTSKNFAKLVEDFKIETLLSDKYDSSNAILSVQSGSGGTDAQDWAEILSRMYRRWAENRGYSIQVLNYQEDAEGGIKNATFLIEGLNAYGYLKNEKGVHRLVRISPYDSAKRRHTSFASIEVVPEIEKDVDIEINSEDIRTDVFRASGAGGQHVNKSETAVRLTHIPTNIVVSCQNERSQNQNKEMAMRVLKSKLLDLKIKENKEHLEELKGDYSQITWGSQIRSYVFHPYTMVKDHRTNFETGNLQKVLDGDLDPFIHEKLKENYEKSK